MILVIGGVRVHVEGEEHMRTDRNCLVMFSHASNLDPPIIGSGLLDAKKWVGKRALFCIPFIGWAMWLFGHISVDRRDRQKAIESLKSALVMVKKYKRGIAISPEGTRSNTGRLLDFKKGPFYLAEEVRLPISPMVIIGAYELW